jgi:hypothetical protein
VQLEQIRILSAGADRGCGVRVGYRFLPPTRMLRSGRSLESAVAVDQPTRLVPPSTSTRALVEEDLIFAA